jgi:hypothetical protein
VEGLAENSPVDHTAEDMAGAHYKGVHCHRMEFAEEHMVVEGPVDSHSVDHKGIVTGGP